MNQQVLEFIGVWGFIISIIGFVVTIVLLAFNLSLIRRQLLLAEKQHVLEYQSRYRQEWINGLRDTVAELVGSLVVLSEMPSYEDLERQERLGEFEEKIQEVESCAARISLMLNLTEPDHQTLLKSITATILALQSFGPDESEEALEGWKSELKRGTDTVLEICRSILKREWERVKRGE